MTAAHATTDHHDGTASDPLPYNAAEVQDLLGRLASVIPTLATLRTDKFKPEEIGPGNPQRVFIEYGANQVFKLSLASETGASPHVHIGSRLKIDENKARYALRILKHITTLNHLGAWCVSPSEVDELVLHRDAVGSRPLGVHSYLRETCDLLAEELPHVGEIRIEYQITQVGPQQRGQQRRRAFLRFLAPDGIHEVAALDAAGFALHARHQLLEPAGESMLELNLSRMDHWSRQLGVSSEVLAEIFGMLTFLTSALHVTRIQLR